MEVMILGKSWNLAADRIERITRCILRIPVMKRIIRNLGRGCSAGLYIFSIKRRCRDLILFIIKTCIPAFEIAFFYVFPFFFAKCQYAQNLGVGWDRRVVLCAGSVDPG
jgi:hypothetical protein